MADEKAPTVEKQLLELQKQMTEVIEQNNKLKKDGEALAELQGQMGQLIEQNNNLKKEGEALGELQKTVLQQGETIGSCQQEIGALRKENAELLSALKRVETPKEPVKPVTPAKTFPVNGKTYKFVLPQFTIPARKKTDSDPGRAKAITISAVDALSDPNILAELVKLGSGVIKEVK